MCSPLGDTVQVAPCRTSKLSSPFLVDQGLDERRRQQVILARHLPGTLRGREIEATANTIGTRTGLTHRLVADGERVSGIYRRSFALASGRFVMLDDGVGFRLVPWKPVIERRLGQTMTALRRGSGLSWEFGRQRGTFVGWTRCPALVKVGAEARFFVETVLHGPHAFHEGSTHCDSDRLTI